MIYNRSTLTGLSCGLLAFLILYSGYVLPDARLTFFSVPLNLFPVAAAVLLIAVIYPGRELTVTTLRLLLPLYPISITLLWSDDIFYGANKIVNLLGSTIVATVILILAARILGTRGLLMIWIGLLLALLLFAAAYKIQYGFFDREVSFLVSGPIGFARLMGLACVGAMFVFQGWLSILVGIVFFLAVLWTNTKGVILPLILVLAFYFFVLRGNWTRSGIAAGIVAVAAIWGPESLANLRDVPQLSRLAEGIDALVGQTRSDSVADRLEFYSSSLDLLRTHLFSGVGLGGWAGSSELDDRVLASLEAQAPGERYRYPHNMPLELLSEGGIILGVMALLPFLLFLSNFGSPFAAISLFCLLCQMFSGDLQDGRYALTFALLTYASLSQRAKEE